MKEALNLAEGMFAHAGTATILMDEKGIIKRWNQMAEETFGWTADEAVGRNITIIMPEPFRSQHNQYLEKYLQSGVKKVIGGNRDVKAVTKDGRRLIVALRVNEIRTGDNSNYYVGLMMDVTASRDAQVSLFDLLS